MLGQIIKYAHEVNLSPEPGFTSKEIRWMIQLSHDGKYTGVVPLGEGKKGRTYLRCPEFSQSEMKFFARRTAAGEPDAYGSHFLASECSVIALLAKDAPDSKTVARHQFFLALLRDAAQAWPVLTVVAACLCDKEIVATMRADLTSGKAKVTDKATFSVGGVDLMASSDWQSWWRNYRRSLASRMADATGRKSLAGDVVCLATGDVGPAARLHPTISGLADVGAQPKVPFISFKEDAYCSYGLKQSENAAVGELAAAAYRDGLNHLIARAPKIAGMKVLHWFDRFILDEDDVVLAVIGDDRTPEVAGARERARKLVDAIRSGQRPDLLDASYFVLAVSGASGRAITRDWSEGPFQKLALAIDRWFDDLSIVSAETGQVAPAPKLESVVTAGLRERSPSQKFEEWIKPVGQTRVAVWRAALNENCPIPDALALAALAALRSSIIADTNPFGPRTTVTRVAILKAHIRRNLGGHEMAAYLNEDHPSTAYQCGRMLAVYGRLQQTALGSVGAGVVERFYGAASSTPALAFCRLARLSKFHLSALKNPKLAWWYEKTLSDIAGRISGDIPSTVPLNEQTLFALGYYQQYAFLTNKSADSTKEPTNG